MKWQITKKNNGEFVAEYGVQIGGGCVMPAFIVYESATFKTRRQAEKYIDRGGISGNCRRLG